MEPIYRCLDAHQNFDEKEMRDFLRKEKLFQVLDYGKDAQRLQDVMVADELYAAYPILKNALIHFEKSERGLFGMARGGAITLNGRNDDNEQKRTIVHEVQHVIQELEEFATGGSEDFARSVLEDAISYAEARRGDAQAALESYEKIRGLQGVHRPDYAKRVKEADDRVKELEALRNANISDFDLYERLAGEIEARNVEHRLDLSERKRFLVRDCPSCLFICWLSNLVRVWQDGGMDKKNLLLLLVPLVLGACHYHDGYARARVYPVPVAYRANYPVHKPVKPKPVKAHKRPMAKKHKVYGNSYDTQNRTYADKYISPPPCPVPVGAWQGRPLREPQMPGYAVR